MHQLNAKMKQTYSPRPRVLTDGSSWLWRLMKVIEGIDAEAGVSWTCMASVEICQEKATEGGDDQKAATEQT